MIKGATVGGCEGARVGGGEDALRTLAPSHPPTLAPCWFNRVETATWSISGQSTRLGLRRLAVPDHMPADAAATSGTGSTVSSTASLAVIRARHSGSSCSASP